MKDFRLSQNDTDATSIESDPYYGLLSNPPGKYYVANYGSILALILIGSDTFIRRAHNWISSFGGEGEWRGPVMYRGEKPGTCYMGISEERVKKAVYCYTLVQILRQEGAIIPKFNEEGEFNEIIGYSNETICQEKAHGLAERFWSGLEMVPLARTVGLVSEREFGKEMPLEEYSLARINKSLDLGV